MGLAFGTDLTGKVAVVTGAGGVLCGMFAKTLAEAGAKVAVLDLNEEAAQAVADEIAAAGGQAKRQMFWKKTAWKKCTARYYPTLDPAISWSTVPEEIIQGQRRPRNILNGVILRPIPFPSLTWIRRAWNLSLT